jgi:type II secretory pathway predicted ATPase ExeA
LHAPPGQQPALIRDLAPGVRPRSNAEDLVHQVATQVATKFAAGEVSALLIEEAHELAADLWLDLKKVREICADAGGALAVVCIGQTEARPDLDETLDQPELVAVRRRLLVYEIDALSAGQARKYIDFRLTQAGARPGGIVAGDAVDLLIKTLSPGGRGTAGARLYPALLDTWLSTALIEGWSKGARMVGRNLMSHVLTTGGGDGEAEAEKSAECGTRSAE